MKHGSAVKCMSTRASKITSLNNKGPRTKCALWHYKSLKLSKVRTNFSPPKRSKVLKPRCRSQITTDNQDPRGSRQSTSSSLGQPYPNYTSHLRIENFNSWKSATRPRKRAKKIIMFLASLPCSVSLPLSIPVRQSPYKNTKTGIGLSEERCSWATAGSSNRWTDDWILHLDRNQKYEF